MTHFCNNCYFGCFGVFRTFRSVILYYILTREEAKKEIEKLVARFTEHREEYHLPEYNETKTRQDFVNPFFKALGWDMDNTGEASEAYREVIHEDKVKVQMG